MLSILIPTYNYDCTSLVHDLQQQAQQAGIDYEIVVADDASPLYSYKEKNREINSLPHCKLIELPENIGRARIRNRLAEEAQYEWLLFMDADAEVINENFITDYFAHTDADVICGGLCHAETLPSPEVSLRYAYEKRADRHRKAKDREQAPYEQFITFCFMIRANLFHTIKFDESITEYGHEDTLFGIELGKRKVCIKHIDNPMRQGGIETNEEFLEKTRAAIRNLAVMESTMQGHSALLNVYRLLHKTRITSCIAWLFKKKRNAWERRLQDTRPNLTLFFAYKLGYYCRIKKDGPGI